ncbi:MAG TPA: M20/M25/M40 family metallo-hydrolase, partial [Blastocatellia bacterium]|nr:M20/M25/M40 family metallo-hydrolase [Blastocatellia bacterium]
ESGYLRLREIGSLRMHPLWIQFHEGQRVRVLTRGGPIRGAAIVKSTHLQRGRIPNGPLATLDDLWIDVGASSQTDARRLGIELLDPVVRDFSSWSYADYVAGPLAGVRVGCAALATAARGEVRSGETTFVISTLRSFGNDGLEAALRKIGRVDELTLVDQVAGNSADSVRQQNLDKPSFLPASTGITSIRVVGPNLRFSGSLVESVGLADAEALLAEVSRAAGVTGAESFFPVPAPESTAARPKDLLSPVADLLKTLADIPAVSGHEREVREAILAALPAWARQLAKTDPDGNLIVEAGPDREPEMFIAHQDEVGFEITNIAADGVVALRARGGLFPALWEGQPALLHFDSSAGDKVRPPLSGIFVPRENAITKQPEALTAWFGMDGVELKRLGVTIGQSITADKHATRIGTSRFTARALDDRAGSTALVLAAGRINPATLRHKVILAWSVREETGLGGAMSMARSYGSKLRRVFSIDTFVSSDSPVESTRFAFTPLGQGAVIRGLDNSSVISPSDLNRVLNIARARQIPMQVGATNGGTDGSDFVRYGAPNVSLSWPGRYSHSPVEVLDLRDLDALVRLISALAVAP